MASSSEAALSGQPFITFLAAYPHPAFILAAPSAKKPNPSLHPIFGNGPFRCIVNATNEQEPLDQEFLDCLPTSQFRPYAMWLSSDDPSVTLDVRLGWTADASVTVQLEVTKTRMDDWWVCTTVPRSKIPPPPALNIDDDHGPSKIKRSPGKIPNFPGSVFKSAPPDSSLQITVPDDDQSEMVHRLNTFDWASTSLGPKNKWPQSLLSILSVCMKAPYASAVWWTEESILVYNDKYITTAGSKHPRIFGQAGSKAWAELWETIGPMIANEIFQGRSIHRENHLLFLERMRNMPEECYYDWSYRPVIVEDGTVGGFINDAFDVSDKVITQRRMTCLQHLGTAIGLSANATEWAAGVLATLSREEMVPDVPFAALYICSADEVSASKAVKAAKLAMPGYLRSATSESERQSPPLTAKLELVGRIGIPENHPAAPKSLNLVVDLVPGRSAMVTASLLQNLRDSSSSPTQEHDTVAAASPRSPRASPNPASADILSSVISSGASTNSTDNSTSTVRGSEHAASQVPPPWPFENIIKYRQTEHVSSLPDYLCEGLADKRGWGDKPREAVVIPLVGDDEKLPRAVLVLGVNTRREYDAKYASFVDILRMNLNAGLSATLARESDLMRAEQLAQIDAAKTQFFSNVSHELRTPLTLIKGPVSDAVSILKDDNSIKSNLVMGLRNIKRLERLVDSLMDFSKLAGKKLAGQFQPVKLGIFTADLASLCRSLVEKQGKMKYIVHCDLDLKQPPVYIDPEFWEKIVFNIIMNAYKYTMAGSITVSTKIRVADGFADFIVKDTGYGIPTEDLTRIFDRFHRVESVSRSHEGTGIGLSLTKELVALHGGKIKVESSTDPVNHGSKFIVSIPLGSAHLPPSLIVASSASSRHGEYARGIVAEASLWTYTPAPMSSNTSGTSLASSETSDHSDSDGSSGSAARLNPGSLSFVPTDVILIVDDNTDMRTYVKSIMHHYCKIIEASDGQQALEIALEKKPDLIITDVQMPAMSGKDLLKAIRSRPETKSIPVILVTAKRGEEEQVESFVLGADDYIEKPFKSTEIIVRAHLHLSLGKLRADLENGFAEKSTENEIILGSSPVAIFRTDSTGRVKYVNPRWYEITGHAGSLDDWIESVHEDDGDSVVRFWNEVLEQPPVKSRTFEFKYRNNVVVQMQVLRVGDGGTIGTLTDISQTRFYEEERLAHANEREAAARKRAEEAEARRKEAEERRRGQELLIDVTSHELRQPVSAILNCSSLVRSNMALLLEDLDKSVNNNLPYRPSRELLKGMTEDLDALDSIHQCGLAQERIANDVLSLSRLQLNVLHIQTSNFDIMYEVRRICSIFDNEVKTKKINLSVNFGTSFKKLGITTGSSDRARVGQVITNLLSNAIKFTDTSTTKRDIIVNVEVSLDKPLDEEACKPPPPRIPHMVYGHPQPDTPIYIYMSVTDSGPGLQPDDLMKLFKRFQQGSHRHEVFGGSGLGLFISRKLCDLMGGRIQVESVYGHGATFRFFIESKVGVDAGFTDSISGRSLNHHQTTLSSPFPKVHIPAGQPLPRVMSVEDNTINQTVLSRQLKKAGCEVVLAGNGLQALEKLRSSAKPFDLILMDVEMPVMDGLTAVREIRKMEESGELRGTNRVVALTGNAREGQVKKIREAGMTDVIIKPYTITQLIDKIDESLQQQR